MNYEAKRAVDRVGINPHDLQEKTLEEFKHNAKDENVTDEIVRMRYFHYENRRRKKLKILADYIRNNRQYLSNSVAIPNTRTNMAATGTFNNKQAMEFN